MVKYPSVDRYFLQALSSTKYFKDLPSSLSFVLANFNHWKSEYGVWYVDRKGMIRPFLTEDYQT
jgi:hypothetical protein